MGRPAEFTYQQGTEAEFEAFVRAEFPQCIARDDKGNELAPVQYRSAYDHVVGVHYVPALTLVDGEEPQNQALMVDYHQPPESSDQADRIQARVLFVQLFIDIPDTPPNQDIRELMREALVSLRNTGYPGIQAITVTTLAWAGEPPTPAQQDAARQRLRNDNGKVGEALRAIEKRSSVNPRGNRKARRNAGVLK